MTSQNVMKNFEFPAELRHPVDAEKVLRKRERLRRTLSQQSDLQSCKIAILGGSTTQELKSILDIFLLAQKIQPTFYESEYNAYFEEVMFERTELLEFNPDIVYVHTTWHNISRFPQLLDSPEQVEQLVREEMSRFEMLWEKIHQRLGAFIIQNNFDCPLLRPNGNLEASESYGRLAYINRLNLEFGKYAQSHSRFLLNDINFISARLGLQNWFDYTYWYNYHMAMSPKGTVALSQNLASIVKSIYGKTKKCLVLDLDNTLWGGVVGDDGVQNLILGRDHPVGEAFVNFQKYVKELQKRGVLLAVCSKNDIENAKEGFGHPDMFLKLTDFSAFKANWNPKHENIREIALELNIGLDSLVFIDDNPAERAIVAAQVPDVAVPDVGSDVWNFAGIIEQEGYFETSKIVRDDLERSSFYAGNVERNCLQATFSDYGQFLDSLEMVAEIAPFAPVYMERIAQLINKTNQFNLTTRRYTAAEVEAMVGAPGSFITLYGRLRDKFGDNGLVSVLIGKLQGQVVEISLWLMSCRVLKREMEQAMFDSLVEECISRGVKEIIGVYIPTKKNGMVAKLYPSLGFEKFESNSGDCAMWRYRIPDHYAPLSTHIKKDSVVSAAAGV